MMARGPADRPPGGTGSVRLLASVRSASEARIAVNAGAHVIDAKEPRAGALGALPIETISDIVRVVAGRALVSATVGDLPLDPAVLGPAMLAVASTGVDIVKIGIFGVPDADRLDACLTRLPVHLPGHGTAGMPDRGAGRGALPSAAGSQSGAARIAVLMADQQGCAWPLVPFARHGFAGAMLDTADKGCGGLRAVVTDAELAKFIAATRRLGLQVGLAGSLMPEDVPALACLYPDYLGFRTALCRAGDRQGALDQLACEQLMALLARSMRSVA
jgi:uncharacterized protein (UPF0264 family)